MKEEKMENKNMDKVGELNEHQTSVVKKAIRKHGTIKQMDMCIEECAELIQAINKMKRIAGDDVFFPLYPIPLHSRLYSKTYFDLCSEVADVKIMLAQLELMLSSEAIQLSLERKIERLENRLEK